MADEINIKFGGETGELETALKRVTGEIGKLNTQVERTGDEIQDAFSAESRRAIQQMRAKTDDLKNSVKKLADEEAKAIKTSTSMTATLTKLRATAEWTKWSFELGARALETFVSGVLDAITSADEFIEELDAIQNPLFEFSDATERSIEKVNTKLETMTGLSKALRVQLAEEFSPTVSVVTDALNNLALIYGKANKAVIEFTGGQLGLTKIITDFISGGSLTKLEHAAEAVNMVFGFQKEEVDDLEKQFSSLDDQLDSSREKLDSTSDILEKGLAKLATIEFRADQKTLQGVEKISAAYTKQLDDVLELQKALEELNLTEHKRLEVAQAVSQAIEALFAAEEAEREKIEERARKRREKEAERRQKDQEDIVNSRIDAHQAEIDEIIRKEEEKAQQLKALHLDTAQAAGDAFGMAADFLGDAMEGSNNLSKKQLRTLFGLQKAASIGQATMAGIQASMLALSTPPGPPATFPLAALVGAMSAANVAAIAAQSPPFHIGSRAADLAPDEMRITRREGLAVLTPQGIQSGGAEAVANANAGIPQTDQQTIVFQYQHQMFDATIEDNLKRPNSPLGSVLRSSSYGHRRRNG